MYIGRYTVECRSDIADKTHMMPDIDDSCIINYRSVPIPILIYYTMKSAIGLYHCLYRLYIALRRKTNLIRTVNIVFCFARIAKSLLTA